MENVNSVIARILKDIRVEMADEFDKNFERQAFFSQAWERRHSPLRPGKSILVDTGALRRSIKSQSDVNSVTFSSELPYSKIHNVGGEIKVTAKMKRYFWARYYGATGAFGRKKNGERRNDKRTLRLSSEAEFWKHMALMREGATIKIPQRMFLGVSPDVEKSVREIVENGLKTCLVEFARDMKSDLEDI